MVTGSTRGILTHGTKESIATAYAKHLVPEGPPEWMVDAFKDHMRDEKDQEVWRIGMMIGYFNEDAGENR